MASSGGRSNSRRNRHQRKDSLSVDNVNAEYQARNVRYSHSPTPGNSASKHHRRNSISKAKEAKKNFNLETFVQQQQNLNMKFTDDSMNNPINNNNNINIPLKQYKITAEEHKPPTIKTNSYSSSTKSVPKPQKPQKQRSIPIPTYTKPAASPIPINPHPNDYNDNHNNDNISIPIKNIPASSPQPIPLKNYDSNSSSIIISIGDDRPKSNKYTSRRGHGRHGSSGTHSRHGSGSYHHRHHRSQHSGSNIAIPLSIRPDASPIPQPSKSKYQRAGKSINISISGAKNNNRSSPPKSYQKHRSKPSPHSINIPAAMIPQTSPQPIPSTSNDQRQFTTIQIGNNNITKKPSPSPSKHKSEHSPHSITIPISMKPQSSPQPTPSTANTRQFTSVKLIGDKPSRRHKSKPSGHSITIPMMNVPQTSPQPTPSTSNSREFKSIKIDAFNIPSSSIKPDPIATISNNASKSNNDTISVAPIAYTRNSNNYKQATSISLRTQQSDREKALDRTRNKPISSIQQSKLDKRSSFHTKPADISAVQFGDKFINISEHKESETLHITNDKETEELKEWELRLSIKENELNSMKAKNSTFIASLQKQISQLTKQLEEERNSVKFEKGKMNKEDIKDLDAIRRENCKLRATVHRMKDEMKYMESQQSQSYNINNYNLQKQQSSGSNATTHNNYYINTINYNNIINNHSHMNLQNNNHKWYPLSQGNNRAQTPSDDTPPAPPSGNNANNKKETSPGISKKLLSVEYPTGLAEMGEFKRDESVGSTWTMKYQSSIGSNASYRTHRDSISGVTTGSSRNGDILSIQSISLHEMEKQCNKKIKKLDDRQEKLDKNWKQYEELKENLDFEKQSLEFGKRELDRNNRRLRMKLHQLEILKYENLLLSKSKLYAMDGDEKKESEEDLRRNKGGTFLNMKMNSIKHSISDGYKKRQLRVNRLQQQYDQFETRINQIENSFKSWINQQNNNNKSYSSKIHSTIDKYIENKKKNNGIMRRFDTKQFDPIQLHKNLNLPFVNDGDSASDDNETTPDRKHVSTFSFERNSSFDYIPDENNVAHKLNNGKRGSKDNTNDDKVPLSPDNTPTPGFYRKRTKSRKMDEDEFNTLSPNLPEISEPEDTITPSISDSNRGNMRLNKTHLNHKRSRSRTRSLSSNKQSPIPNDDEDTNSVIYKSEDDMDPDEDDDDNNNNTPQPDPNDLKEEYDTDTLSKMNKKQDSKLILSISPPPPDGGLKFDKTKTDATDELLTPLSVASMSQFTPKSEVEKKQKFGDVDLLRIIKMNQEENDALRMKLSELKCNNFNLKSKFEYVKYDKQLLLDQIEELNEINAELKVNGQKMTELARDANMLREDLIDKDKEISDKEREYADLQKKYQEMEVKYNAVRKMYDKSKNDKKGFMDSLNAYREYIKHYLIEYLWSECALIKNVEDIYNQFDNKQQNINDILKSIKQRLSVQSKKTIEINQGISYKNHQVIKSKKMDNFEMISFDSKTKFNEYITDLNILPSFHYDEPSKSLLKEHKNGITTYLPQSSIIGINSLYASIQLPPILKKTESLFNKLLTQIGLLQLQNMDTNAPPSKAHGYNSTFYQQALQQKDKECNVLQTKILKSQARVNELENKSIELTKERDMLYEVYSKNKKKCIRYKKQVDSMEEEIKRYVKADIEHIQVVQELSNTQNELDLISKEYNDYKKRMEEQVDSLKEQVTHHRKKSSSFIAKQRLDDIIGRSERTLDQAIRTTQEAKAHIDNDDMDSNDEDNLDNKGLRRSLSSDSQGFYYGNYDTMTSNSSMYNTMFIAPEFDVHAIPNDDHHVVVNGNNEEQDIAGHHKSGSTIINEDVIQSSKIKGTNPSRDLTNMLPDLAPDIRDMGTSSSMMSNDERKDDDRKDVVVGTGGGYIRKMTKDRRSVDSNMSNITDTQYGWETHALSPEPNSTEHATLTLSAQNTSAGRYGTSQSSTRNTSVNHSRQASEKGGISVNGTGTGTGTGSRQEMPWYSLPEKESTTNILAGVHGDDSFKMPIPNLNPSFNGSSSMNDKLGQLVSQPRASKIKSHMPKDSMAALPADVAMQVVKNLSPGKNMQSNVIYGSYGKITQATNGNAMNIISETQGGSSSIITKDLKVKAYNDDGEPYFPPDRTNWSRRNTVEDMINKQNEMKKEQSTPISEQAQVMMSPGTSPLPQLGDDGTMFVIKSNTNHNNNDDKTTQGLVLNNVSSHSNMSLERDKFNRTYEKIMNDDAKAVNESLQYSDGELKKMTFSLANPSLNSIKDGDVNNVLTQNSGDYNYTHLDVDDDDGTYDIYDWGNPSSVSPQGNNNSSHSYLHGHNNSSSGDLNHGRSSSRYTQLVINKVNAMHNKNKSSISSRHSSKHSTTSSIASVEYVELSDTLKLSKEKFAELRDQHLQDGNNLVGQLLNQITETKSVQFNDDELKQIQNIVDKHKHDDDNDDDDDDDDKSTATTPSPMPQPVQTQLSPNEKNNLILNNTQYSPHKKNESVDIIDDHQQSQQFKTFNELAKGIKDINNEKHKRNATTVVHVEQLPSSTLPTSEPVLSVATTNDKQSNGKFSSTSKSDIDSTDDESATTLGIPRLTNVRDSNNLNENGGVIDDVTSENDLDSTSNYAASNTSNTDGLVFKDDSAFNTETEDDIDPNNINNNNHNDNKIDQPHFGPNGHTKQNDSIVSANGTHYISYESMSPNNSNNPHKNNHINKSQKSNSSESDHNNDNNKLPSKQISRHNKKESVNIIDPEQQKIEAMGIDMNINIASFNQ